MRAIGLLAAALLLGGLREPRLAALGEAAAFAAVWLERPPLGPAAAWLPWLAWAALAAALSDQPLASLPFLARWAAVLAFFSLAAGWGKQARERWLEAVLAATALLAAAALWTGASSGFRASMTGLIPPYYNYTTFAVSAGVAAGAAWALHPKTARREFRWAGLAAAALGGVALFLAHGRGALLGVAAGAVVWAARRRGGKAALGVVFAAALAAAALAARHGGTYREARLDIWRGAARIAAEHPALGAGPGIFGAAFRLHPAEARGGMARWGMGSDFAHSEVLQAAAETGWAGLALWLLAFSASISFLLGRASEEPAREAAAIAAVAMGVHLCVDNMLQLPGLAFLFFSALAVASPGASSGRRWPRPAVAAAALLAAVAWIPRAWAKGDPAHAVALFPREADPFEDLAYRATAAGDLARADAFWAQAEERAPFDAVYPWRQAQLAAARGRWGDAEALAGRAAALEPGFLDDRVLRAEALLHLGRSRDARAELASISRDFRERGERAGSSGYDSTIGSFDRGNFDRVETLAACAR